MIGVAQEKAYAWRGWRDGGNDDAPALRVRPPGVYVNHYYFYILTATGGPAFVKTNAYAPYPVWIYLNRHVWAKRQAARAAIEFRALQNGFAACRRAVALAAICALLSDADVAGVLCALERGAVVAVHSRRARLAIVTACRSASSSVGEPRLRARRGGAWFELTIADQLDLSRSSRCRSSSGKITRATPGRFQT